MVIRGKSRGNGRQLGNYLLARRDNDQVPEILEMSGFADKDPIAALMNAERDLSLVSQSGKPFYQGILNPRKHEAAVMTDDEWIQAVNIQEKWLKYEGLPRLIVKHVKDGREHVHVTWLRYDHVSSRLRPDSYNYYKQNSARAEIEATFNHKRTPARRDKNREPDHKQRLTELWLQAGDAAGFVALAQSAGYEIGKGLDSRPYRVITPEGKSLNLVRMLDGIQTKDVRTRFERYRLPNEAVALKTSQQRLQQQPYLKANELMEKFLNNASRPANDNKLDIFEELKAQAERARRDKGGPEY